MKLNLYKVVIVEFDGCHQIGFAYFGAPIVNVVYFIKSGLQFNCLVKSNILILRTFDIFCGFLQILPGESVSLDTSPVFHWRISNLKYFL